MLQGREGIAVVWVSFSFQVVNQSKLQVCESFETMTTATPSESVNFRLSKDNLSKLEVDELYEVLKKMKRELEHTRTENIWISKFLGENYVKDEQSDDAKPPKRVAFGSMRFSVAGSQRASLSQSSSAARKQMSSHFVSASLKAVFCEREIYKMEHEMKKLEKQNVVEIKAIVAATEELEISCKELQKTFYEVEKMNPDESSGAIDNKLTSRAFVGFLRDISRTGAITKESIRLKTGTLKSECRKLKRLIMKQEEQSSCLRPVDFELALIEKKKFQKMKEEKQNHLSGLKNDERRAAQAINQEQKQLLQATIEFNQIETKANLCGRLVHQMQRQIGESEIEIEKLKNSVSELINLTNVYEAPSIEEYIHKIKQRDELKKKLKTLNRKTEVLKISYENHKRKLHRQ